MVWWEPDLWRIHQPRCSHRCWTRTRRSEWIEEEGEDSRSISDPRDHPHTSSLALRHYQSPEMKTPTEAKTRNQLMRRHKKNSRKWSARTSAVTGYFAKRIQALRRPFRSVWKRRRAFLPGWGRVSRRVSRRRRCWSGSLEAFVTESGRSSPNSRNFFKRFLTRGLIGAIRLPSSWTVVMPWRNVSTATTLSASAVGEKGKVDLIRTEKSNRNPKPTYSLGVYMLWECWEDSEQQFPPPFQCPKADKVRPA